MEYSYPTIMNNHLNRYCATKVKLSREETRQSVARAVPKIQAILKEINNIDSRFSAQMAPVGSAWTNLKVDRPNEFDVNVPISIPKLPWVTGAHKVTKCYEIDPSDHTKVRKCSTPLKSPPTGYMRNSFDSVGGEVIEPSLASPLNPREEAELRRWETSEMTFEKDLIPVLVRTRFKILLKDVVRSKFRTGRQCSGKRYCLKKLSNLNN